MRVVRTVQGGDAVADTVHTYQELIERFGSSLPLLNGLGGAYMILGRFAEAEKRLIDAIGMVRACVCVCVCACMCRRMCVWAVPWSGTWLYGLCRVARASTCLFLDRVSLTMP